LFSDKIISRMVGKKGMKGGGGARANSGGARAGTGGKREGAGRPPNVLPSTGTPQQISPAKILTPEQKWQFAEYALQYAYEALDMLIHVMRHGESETARITAADKILDRALGKAPPHIDVTALRHTEIVYRSAEQIRQELIARGVPQILLDQLFGRGA
jgi:hypothetical protein